MDCSGCMFCGDTFDNFHPILRPYVDHLGYCAIGNVYGRAKGAPGLVPDPENFSAHHMYVCPSFQPIGSQGEFTENNHSYDHISSNTNPSGCFLTSACVDALGKEDDCYELETLRRFRDEWLACQEGGEQDIARYYAFAPGIVRQIDQLPYKLVLYTAIYNELIAPCVSLIEEKKMQEAWNLYRSYTEELISKYCECAA